MSISPTQILLILVIILLLFGAKKLPDLARSVGRSTRILKSEMREMSNDDAEYQNGRNQQTQQPQPTGLPTSAAIAAATTAADGC